MKLPDIAKGMPIDQACLLELYHILIAEGTITEAQAIDRYFDRQSKFGLGRWIVIQKDEV